MFKRIFGVAAVTTLVALAASPMATAAPVSTTTHEHGYAMTCTGVLANSNEVHVELYTNNTVTVPVNVVVREAGEDGSPLLVSADDAPSPRIQGGRVVADVPLVRFRSDDDAGMAKVRGTYRPEGRVRPVNDDFEDAGERIQVKGTNQDLKTDLYLKIDKNAWVDLECSDAFRFNLRVTKTPIA